MSLSRVIFPLLWLALFACNSSEEAVEPATLSNAVADSTSSRANSLRGARSSAVIFYDNFEAGCWQAQIKERATGGSCQDGTLWWWSQMQSDAAGQVVTQVGNTGNQVAPRKGSYAMQFTWRRDGYRPDDSNNTMKAHLWTPFENKTGTTRWYRFSMYLPSGSGGMLADSEPEILAQWHGQPDRENGEPFRIPTAALSHVDDRLVFYYFYDPLRISTEDSYQRGGSVELGDATLDQWIDFFFRIRWDYAGKGYLEINRKDQVPGAEWRRLIKQDGLNIGYNDASDPNVGIGIYKHDAGRRHQAGKPLSDYYQRRVYFDEFYVGTDEPITTTTTDKVTLRARGAQGTEQLVLRYNDTVSEPITLSTEFKEYHVPVDNPIGNFKVAFINDSKGRDVRLDWLRVNGQLKKSADQEINTASFTKNGGCGTGGYSQAMYCNGYIDFGTFEGSAK